MLPNVLVSITVPEFNGTSDWYIFWFEAPKLLKIEYRSPKSNKSLSETLKLSATKKADSKPFCSSKDTGNKVGALFFGFKKPGFTLYNLLDIPYVNLCFGFNINETQGIIKMNYLWP